MTSGDVVTVTFTGATGRKRRPAMIVSSNEYHAERPDLILGILTSNVDSATATTDHVLNDWQSAGLRRPSAFRCYLGMAVPSQVQHIGHLSDQDWDAVRACVRKSFA
jgi:mRNA interferase MazF